MIALAFRIFGWLLTIEFGRVERLDDDEPADIIPARQFHIGFAAPEHDGDGQDDEDDEEDTGVKTW